MKKYEELFTQEEDFILFPTLIRSMKETCFRKFTIKDIIKICLASRKEYKNESLYTNASFWPKDLGTPTYSYSALFVARLINSKTFNKKLVAPVFYENFNQYVENFTEPNKAQINEIIIALKKINNFSLKQKKVFEDLICGNEHLIENFITPYQIHDKF